MAKFKRTDQIPLSREEKAARAELIQRWCEEHGVERNISDYTPDSPRTTVKMSFGDVVSAVRDLLKNSIDPLTCQQISDRSGCRYRSTNKALWHLRSREEVEFRSQGRMKPGLFKISGRKPDDVGN